jgi:hypothetical protein
MSLQECVRSMLKQVKFPYYFWVEVIGMAIYLQNRIPSKTIARKTPKKM